MLTNSTINNLQIQFPEVAALEKKRARKADPAPQGAA